VRVTGRKPAHLDQFRGLMAGKKDPRCDIAAWTAPASGLFLETVKY
jgi:hypothetical protein